VTQDGDLTACSLVFSLLGSDYSYKRGGIINTTGNFSVRRAPMNSNGPIVFGLKMIVDDYINGAFVSAKIAKTHLVAADGTVWKNDDEFNFEGEVPGSKLLLLFLGDASGKFLEGILKDKQFTVAFNREPGGTDVRQLVDLTVEYIDNTTAKPVRSNKAVENFGSCLREMFADIPELK
jgi:hypothetical protein